MSSVEEPTIVDPAAETAVAPRIPDASEDAVDEPLQTDATDSDDSDMPDDSDFSDDSEIADDSDESVGETSEPDAEGRTSQRSRILVFGVLPGLALLLALTAGFLKYVDNSVRDNQSAGIESLQVAKGSTVALLSYKPDTVEKQLTDARSLLTGEFLSSYTNFTTNVVIPRAKQQKISASSQVPAAASVSANPDHAVALLFVNQTVVVGENQPYDNVSAVRVTLDKVGDKWLISRFDPVL